MDVKKIASFNKLSSIKFLLFTYENISLFYILLFILLDPK